MNYIICSDIHSNLPALLKFQSIIKNYFPNHKLICLGDIIGYGASPNETINIVKEMQFLAISGNHERMLFNEDKRKFANSIAQKAIIWTESQLTKSESEFLKSLPEYIKLENNMLLVHGSPKDPDEYILSSIIALENFEILKNSGVNICFFGHTHVAGIFDSNGIFYYSLENEFILEKDQIYLINPGSIGQPRDGDNRGCFCTFEEENMKITFHRFEYDISLAYNNIKEKNLPIELGMRLFYGY